MHTVDVEIAHGKVRGARHEGVTVFKGIPYAGRVSGDRRFRRPAELQLWPGVRMLTREMAAETTALVLQALNIAPNNWRKLLDVPAAELLRIQSHFPPVPPHQRRKTAGSAEAPIHGFGPEVDGGDLPAHPFDPTAPAISRKKPLITGWNEDEDTFFAWEFGRNR